MGSRRLVMADDLVLCGGRAVFGIAIVTVVFASAGHLGTAASFNAGFAQALAVAAGLSLIGAAVALAVGTRRPAGSRPGPSPAPATAPASA